jgi:hypothetical protein
MDWYDGAEMEVYDNEIQEFIEDGFELDYQSDAMPLLQHS